MAYGVSDGWLFEVVRDIVNKLVKVCQRVFFLCHRVLHYDEDSVVDVKLSVVQRVLGVLQYVCLAVVPLDVWINLFQVFQCGVWRQPFVERVREEHYKLEFPLRTLGHPVARVVYPEACVLQS